MPGISTQVSLPMVSTTLDLLTLPHPQFWDEETETLRGGLLSPIYSAEQVEEPGFKPTFCFSLPNWYQLTLRP